ncbi:MAG: chorismate-binding protein, partial [Chloroflexota bacterium]|nr:chorismate-binding protein [Chloroflexota bacterium]
MAWTERDRLVWGFLEALKPEEDCVLLLTGRTTPQEHRSYLFLRPQQVITCRDMAQIESSLQALERALEEGYYLAGFLSYEAGFAFERGFVHPPKGSFPLLWFGVYDQPIIFDHGQGCFINPRSPGTTPPFPSLEPPAGEGYSLEGLTLSVPKGHYAKAIQAVRDYIAQGETYQVNYTLKCRFSFSGSPYRFFLDLNERQHVSYAAFLKFGSHLALSLSPELFFRKRGRNMVVRPMKGTWQRGRTGPEDAESAQKLASSLKNRAENVMIVDLLRNDLGRLSEVGSVQTTRLFDVERYDTLLQMTSTVESKLRPGVSLYELFAKIFPCGSITGAPKIRTMQIIHELEHEPRRIYTGSIGHISPH